MAAKNKLIDFANDSIEVLQGHLAKLKKDEAKLEIALILRNFPTVENELVRLITCVVELGNVERCMRMESTQTSTEEVNAKKALIEQQLNSLKQRLIKLPPEGNAAGDKLRVFYTQQIAKLTEDKPTIGMSKKNLKFVEHYEETLRTLKSLYDAFSGDKFPASFDVFYYVPKLKYYLDIASDLVARKG